MTFDWMTFGLQLVNVLILLEILRRFLFRPVAAIIAQRQQMVQDTLDAAAQAEQAAKAATERASEEATATARARAGVLDKARTEAEAKAETIRDAARTEAARIIAAGEAARDNDSRRYALQRLEQARDLATAIATRVLSEKPSGTGGYIDRLEAALAAMDQTDRQKLLAAGVTIQSAAKIGKSDRARLEKLCGSVPAYDITPSLIEGVELHSTTGVLHNSVAHDLSVLAKAMNDDSA